VRPGHDVGNDGVEEVLDTGSRSRRATVVLTVAGLAVLAGLVVALTRSGSGTPATTTSVPSLPTVSLPERLPTAVAGNDVLEVSLNGGSGLIIRPLGGNRWSVVATAVLTNFGSRALQVFEPVGIAGRGIGTGVIVKTAEIASGEYSNTTVPPRPLTRIPSGANVQLWIHLEVDCGILATEGASIANLGVIVAMSNVTSPAIFQLGQLVSLNPDAAQSPPCRSRLH
jgi:hypothetical protein